MLQGKSPSEKCDVYSLGIVLWQLKTRCRPYHEMDNVETVIYKVLYFLLIYRLINQGVVWCEACYYQFHLKSSGKIYKEQLNHKDFALVYRKEILIIFLKNVNLPFVFLAHTELILDTFQVVKCNCRPEISIPTDDYSKLYQACWDPDPNSRPSTWNILYKLKLML